MALCYWSAGSRQDEPVNANQAIRAAGGGPEERVAVHVKQQLAGMKHVRDDLTCVHGTFCELMAFSALCSCHMSHIYTDQTDLQTPFARRAHVPCE